MHIPDETQILLIPACLTDGTPPLLNSFEYLHLYATCPNRRSFRESSNELIEELLCTNLQMKGITTILDADIEEIEGEHGDIWITMVDIVDNGDSCFSGRIALFKIDQIGDLEVESEIWLKVLGTACLKDITL